MILPLLLTLAAAAPAPQLRTDTTFEVDARGRLDLENHNGDILIRSWDRSAIHLRAEHDRRNEIEIQNVGSVVRVEADRDGGNANVRYEITVPRAFGVTVDAHNGSVVLENMGGEVEAETVNGSIVLRGGTGRIKLESVSGEIIVDGARGSIEAVNVNHSIRISRSSGDITAEAVNGGIRLSDIEARLVEAETVNGGIDYSGTIRPDGRYTLSSHNGSVTMSVPDGTNASFTVVTHAGSIETDFPVQVREMDSRRRVSFRLGEGGATIQLESFSGSVRLRRPGSR